MKKGKVIKATLALAATMFAIGCSDDDGTTLSTKTDTKPVMTIIGKNPDTLMLNAKYTDLGAVITDAEDGTINKYTKISNLDSSKAGNYSISYTAYDSDSNMVTASRAISVLPASVIDTTYDTTHVVVKTEMDIELTSNIQLLDSNVIYTLIKDASINGDITIGSNVTLLVPKGRTISVTNGTFTIMDGATIKFSEGSYISIGADAHIQVAGTALNPTTFTELTAGEGWGYVNGTSYSYGINIENDASTGSKIDYAIIDKASVGIQVNRVSGLTLTNSILSNSMFYGLNLKENTSVSIETNTGINNQVADVMVDSKNLTTFTADNVLEKGIHILDGAEEFNGHIPALNYTVLGTFYISGSDIPGNIVTIDAGANFKLRESSYISVGNNGQIHIAGTAENLVTFTAAEPGKFWGYENNANFSAGILIENDAATGNLIENALFDSSTVAIKANRENGISVKNCTIKNSKYHGMYLAEMSTVAINANKFVNNAIYDVYAVSNVLTTFTADNELDHGVAIADGAEEINGHIPALNYTILGIFYIAGTDIPGNIVTIDAGSSFKVRESGYIEIGNNGQLHIAGTSDSTVAFSPAEPGKFWGYENGASYSGGIMFTNDAATGSIINYAALDSVTLGISSDQSNAVTVTNTTITNYKYYGILDKTNAPEIGYVNNADNTISSTIIGAIAETFKED